MFIEIGLVSLYKYFNESNKYNFSYTSYQMKTFENITKIPTLWLGEDGITPSTQSEIPTEASEPQRFRPGQNIRQN